MSHSHGDEQALEGGDLIEKGLPCWREECGSSDAVAHYGEPRERYHCFSCGSTQFVKAGAVGERSRVAPVKAAIAADVQEVLRKSQPKAIPSRKLTQESCRKWDYLVTKRGETFIQCAVYRDPKGNPVGIKMRDPSKSKDEGIFWVGRSKENLYGRSLWNAGGKKLVIVEGEIDAVTVSQMQSHQWPVVSVPHGAAEAKKAIAHNLEWINTFEEVLFGFDMDDQGREACVECAALVPPGKAKIIKWLEKDANEMLLQGSGDKITSCIWQAEVWRPDGIVDARDLTEACLASPTWGVPFPYKFLTDWTYGMKPGEVYSIGAGYGIGKTDFESQVVASLLKGETMYGEKFDPCGVVMFCYEGGGPIGTKKAIAGKLAGKRFHLPIMDEANPEWTQAELSETLRYMDNDLWNAGGQLYLYDSKGAGDWEAVEGHCRFEARANGVKFCFIDPLSAMVEEEAEGDMQERKTIDKIMRRSAKLGMELGMTFLIFSHLTQPKEGVSHEEGAEVRGRQFRGSNAIGMFSDYMIGLERNTKADDAIEKAVMRVRMVKDRKSGRSTGKVSGIVYDSITGIYDVPNDLGDFAG